MRHFLNPLDFSIEELDTLMDLANYAIMTILEMDGEEGSLIYANGRPVEFVKEGTLCGNENS